MSHNAHAEERETRISLMDLIDEHRNGWVRKGSGSSADLADAIRARFTVFEKAHAPTDADREAMIDALLETDLIAGYDWLGTGSRYPTNDEIRREVGEAADAILARFRLVPRGEAESDEREALWNLIENDHVYETDYFRNGDLKRQGCSCGEEVDWNTHGEHLIDEIFAAGFRRGAPAEPAVTRAKQAIHVALASRWMTVANALREDGDEAYEAMIESLAVAALGGTE